MMQSSPPLSAKKASQLSLEQIEGLFRDNRQLHFELTTAREKNIELTMKLTLLDSNFILREKELLSRDHQLRDMRQLVEELESNIESLSLELKQLKHHSKPNHSQKQHLMAKAHHIHDSLQKERSPQPPPSKLLKQLPQLNPIANIENYQINQSFGESPFKEVESRLINHREKRFREIVTSYEMTLTEKNQMEEQCEHLAGQVEVFRNTNYQLESQSHLLRQENIELKVRLAHLSKYQSTEAEEEEQKEEEEEGDKDLEIELLTESNNRYYSLLGSLVSSGHSKEATEKMKEILGVHVYELNELKSKMEVEAQLEELEFIYRQENENSDFSEAELIQRRKEVEQFRKKFTECKHRLLERETDKDNLLFELTGTLRHQNKLVTYSLQLEKKLRHQEGKEGTQTMRLTDTGRLPEDRDFCMKRTVERTIQRPISSSRLMESRKPRISFYQGTEAQQILKDVANKDKEMLERLLRHNR